MVSRGFRGTGIIVAAINLSPNGATLLGGSSGSLVTSDGTWTFGKSTGSGNYFILLNGQVAASGSAAKLLIANSHLYADTVNGEWYEWINGNWAAAGAPTVPPAGAANLSPNGATLLAGSGGSLVTSAGTWTFGKATTGGYVVLLNGKSAGTGSGTELLIANGQVYVDNTQGHWYEWVNGSWTSTAAPPIASPTVHPSSLTVAENGSATAIGIAAPSAPGYSSAQLSVRVGGLPGDGTVLLSDGVTAVTAGETLSVAQLTGLMFRPTGSVFSQSSNFTYTVSTPSGLSTTGSATLAIGPDTVPPITSPASLTVAENSGPRPIGIMAPSDPNYLASKLSVRVTVLPSDGTVLLADGVTAVTAGETLSVAQLTGLMFRPTGSVFGQSSSFNYTVSNPSGLSTGGLATLAIGPDTVAPTTPAATLTVAENSGPAAIGIAVPSDPNYAAAQLSVQVTGLPSDGAVLLSDGITAVTAGETLSVAQLTGLMFRPTGSVFGQSSSFNYTVSNPSGLSTAGSATLAIGPQAPIAQGSLTIDPASLTVPANSGATVIGITAPSDSIYLTSRLSVQVTGLPSDGAVLLSDGITAVTAGETLSVAQLAGLMFMPTAGVTSGTSSFTYDVTDPSGASGSGTESLTIAPQPATNGFSADGATLLGGSGGTLVTSDGTWTLGTATGSGNYFILLNGQVAGGGAAAELLIANGHLYADTVNGESYEWGGSSWTSSSNLLGTAPVTAPTTSVAPTAPPAGTSTAPSLPPPTFVSTSLPTQPLSFALQNTLSTALSPHEVTFGEVFSPGQVPGGSQLLATINGVQYVAQLDVRTSYADGSVESGVVTLDAPAIPANTTLNGVLSTTTATPAAAVNIANLPGNGYNLVVNLTMHNADGTQSSDQLNVGTLLSQALSSGTASYWMKGAQATEVQFDVPISGSFHVTFDVTDYADGTTATNVQFNNDDAMQPTGGPVTYDETITENGRVVSQQGNITQYQYQDWNTEAWSNGAPQVNVQHNVLALEQTGAIQGFDLSFPFLSADPNLDLTLASEAAAIASPGWDTAANGTLPVDGILQYMPETGGRPDIGPATQATALWLISQSQIAADYALGQADAAGSVPWNLYNPTTGEDVSVFQYPQLWADARGGPASGTTGLTQQIDMTDSGWTPDLAHQPDLSYEAYLLTGDVTYLNDLNAQANYSIVYDWPGARDQAGYTDIVVNGIDQVRQQAWSLREIDEAAYANPTGSAEKAYFTQVMNDNWSWLVNELPTWTAEEGQAYGYIPGFYGSGIFSATTPWEQDYFASAVVEAAEMGNQDAVKVLQWESNFLVGRFLNGTNGFDPNDGTTYNLIVGNGTSFYQTWAQIEAATQAAGQSLGTGWTDSDYAELALESLSGIITVDSLYPTAAPVTFMAAAMQAYGWLLASGAPYLHADAQFQIAPRLPDGNYLDQSNIQIDTTSNNLTLNTTPGADSLIHAGGGNDTLEGGVGTTDLLFGGTGNDTFKAGTGNEYMFGGTSTNTFIDGTGNNYMQGNGTANTYVFMENHSGHDTIANFNVATDSLHIAANVDGNGLTTAAGLIATATVSNGNTVLHMSPQDDITLLNIATPSTLAHSILVS